MATAEDSIPVSAAPGRSYSSIAENENVNGECSTYQANGKCKDSEKERFTTSHGLQTRSPTFGEKTNRKRKPGNDSALAVMCQWIVNHQIGELVSLTRRGPRKLTECRAFYESTPSTGNDTHVLPSSATTYHEVLSAFVLQTFNGEIYPRLGRCLSSVFLDCYVHRSTSSGHGLHPRTNSTDGRYTKKEGKGQVCRASLDFRLLFRFLVIGNGRVISSVIKHEETDRSNST